MTKREFLSVTVRLMAYGALAAVVVVLLASLGGGPDESRGCPFTLPGTSLPPGATVDLRPRRPLIAVHVDAKMAARLAAQTGPGDAPPPAPGDYLLFDARPPAEPPCALRVVPPGTRAGIEAGFEASCNGTLYDEAGRSLAPGADLRRITASRDDNGALRADPCN